MLHTAWVRSVFMDAYGSAGSKQHFLKMFLLGVGWGWGRRAFNRFTIHRNEYGLLGTGDKWGVGQYIYIYYI